MDRPKYHELEGEDGPEGKEIVLKHYNIKKSWNFGTKEGSLFITNHRLLYERFDGKAKESIPHGLVDYARGSNNGGLFGTAGIVTLCLRDGKTQRGILCDIGEEVVNYLNSTIYTIDLKVKRKINAAKRHERLLEFDEAVEIYKKLGKDEEVIRVRKEQRNNVNIDQTVVHGDYVDDRDTIIKDSVLNRSNVGGKSSKAEELREAKSLLDEGLINENDYEKMKKEILGK